MTGSPKTALRSLHAVFFAVAALAMVNALLFAASTANWLPTADNWFYLDRIVYPYAHGQFDPNSLLVKRSAFDHSQPLRRLLLLANYEWFDLDFRVEAIFAVLAGIANFLLIGFCVRRELSRGMPVSGLAFAVLGAIYFSLSATVVFTWSLLTLSFTSQFFILLWMLASWGVLEKPALSRIVLLIASTFAMGLISDDTSLVAVIAGAMASLIHAGRSHAKRAAILQVAASAIGLGLYLGFYHAVAPAVPSAGAGRLMSAQGLFSSIGDVLPWGAAVPFSSAIVHRGLLRTWFGGSTEAIVLLMAAGFVVAHAWFWKQAIVGDRNRTAFMATVFMLLFYGLVAAIIIGRVSRFGADYLWQPRYAIVYRWHVVALLLMVLAQSQRIVRSPGTRRTALALLSIPLLAQLPIGMAAWNSAKYIRATGMRMADQIVEMGGSAEALPSRACASQLTVCKFDDARRERLVAFLRDQHLSVFSGEVRERNGYRPRRGGSGTQR
ncbi:MAG TPA: hypothetical protein VFI32_00635 [Rhodanobacteraceae bacterium]|nr:hypothetical protein [Rhodanobacteraceae bacterium]